MHSRTILEKYYQILSDLKEVVNSVPIYKLDQEKEPDDFSLSWKSSLKDKKVTFSDTSPDKLEIPSDARNVTCKLCPERVSAIRGFIHKGTVGLLVLHYTGEISPNKKIYSKIGKKQIFREELEEDIFDRMIKKVFNIGMRDLYFQEFPGCNFNPKSTEKSRWMDRTKNCLSHVHKTVTDEGIRGIIITGRAAVSYYGYEKAESMLDKIYPFEFDGLSLPAIVIRSPEKLLSLEENKKKYEKSKNKIELEKAITEEREIKIQVVNTLTQFKQQVLL